MDAVPERTPATTRAPLSEAELGALIGAVSGASTVRIRNRALLACLAGSGCKPGEALRLRLEDVDLDGRRLTLCSRDGSRERVAPLLPAAVPQLEAWRIVRGRDEHGASDAFFCTRDGGELESSYLRRLLARTARASGIGRTVNAGLLRATFAAHLARLGTSLGDVQAMLGHRDARSTLHLLQPVLSEVGGTSGEGAFAPGRWALPGAEGTLRVELVVRERTPSPDVHAPDPVEAVDADPDGATVVRPARWREL